MLPWLRRARALPRAAWGWRGAGRTAMTPLPLAYALLDGHEPRAPLVLLHGLFGSKANFRGVAPALVQRTGRKVLTIDARNHGESPHSPIMTYEAMSLDVQHLLSQLHISKCILIGHSMGGKTAMTLALQRPDLVERLVSVDISPTPTGPVTSFPAYISAMKSMSLPRGIPRSTARRLAEDQLHSVVQVPAVRQFLLTNLVEVEGHYMWRLNLEAISHHLPDIMTFPAFQSYYPGPTLFLRGSKSPYVSDKDFSEIERLFPKAKIQCIAGADHWVHADRPQEFIAAICNFLLLP